MKNYSLLATLAVCCAFGLMPNASYGQGRTLNEAQLEAIVKPSMQNCTGQSGQLNSGGRLNAGRLNSGGQFNAGRIDPASVIPTNNKREITTDRVARTLHGVWQGVVFGDDKELVVDYFWIADTKNNEGLIVALRNGKQTVAGPTPEQLATAPKFTFLMCPNEGYIPSKDVPMIHQFVKVKNSIEDAPQILEKATGVKFSKPQPSLSEMWQEIVSSGYFEGLPAVAFGGGIFKPMQIGSVANPVGPAGVSMQWNAEYRGGGATAIHYTTGVPLVGVEHAEFVGTTTKSGDYLVSSPGNGKIWKVEASMPGTKAGMQNSPAVVRSVSSKGKTVTPAQTDPTAGSYCLAFDSVTLGPLQ